MVRTRTTALQIHTRQWIGTYAGKGNGDYRGELASARRPITDYLKHFAFPPQMARVRLDGAYGDATVIAQLLLAGTSFVKRWRGYLLLELPQIQRVLAHAPTASMTRMNSGQFVEVFALWLAGTGCGTHAFPVRVMVARHSAPAPGKDIPVGKRVGEWVYELFITTLSADGFLVEDVLDLYQGRGADRGPCWPTRPIVSAVICATNVWHQEQKEIAPVASALCAVSYLPLHLCLLSESRSCLDRSDGWIWQVERFAAPG